MSAEEETTQPIEAPELHAAPSAPYNRLEGNGETSIQSATLPSTAIGGHADTNKMTATELPPVALLPLAAALPLIQPQQALPEYHKPIMSQGDGTLFDDAGLFSASAAPSSPVPVSAPQISGEIQDNHPFDPFVANPPQPSSNEGPRNDSTNPATSALNPSDRVPAPDHSAQDLVQPVSAPNMGDSIEDPMENGDQGGALFAADPEDANADGNNSSVEMSDRDRDIAAMQESLVVAQEERRTSMQPPAPPAETARSTRKKRPVSHSQGVRYDYADTGTLRDDSEDEDGGWDSDEEERATQMLVDDSPMHGFVGKATTTASDDEAHEEDDELELQPAAKKKKEVEVDDSAVHKHQIVQLIPEDDDIEYTGSTSAKKATLGEEMVMDTDEVAPASKPRPSLGNVGSSAKSAESNSVSKSKASTTPSKKAVTAKASAMEIDDDTLRSAPSSTPKGNSTTPKKASSKKASAIAVGDNNVMEETSTNPSASRSGTAASSSQGAASSTSKAALSKKSTPKSSQADEEHTTPTRPKRARTSQPSTPTSKSSKSGGKEKIPTAELACALRKNARESIARYLQQESEDMTDFFTQRHVNMSSVEAQDAPPNMLKRFSFIISGLRSVNETASSASFIKTQIKALGGRIVNFRPPNRKKAKKSSSEDNFELEMAQTILISEKPQRTLKYINALASGVPCVHYRWLLACLHQGKLLPLEEFLLPAGYNEDSALIPIPSWFVLEDQDDVLYTDRYPFFIPEEEDHEEGEGDMTSGKAQTNVVVKRKTKRRSSAPDNYRVEVIGTHGFQHQWKAILKQVGAKVVERLDAVRDYGTLDFVLSDAEPTDLHIKLALARGLPLCTIDWALQSIIQRKVQDPMSKPAYTLNTEDF